jgi:hypothetical protein
LTGRITAFHHPKDGMMLSCRSKTGSILLWRAGLGKIPAKTRQSRGNQQPENDFSPRPFPVPGYDQLWLMGIGKAEATAIQGPLVTVPRCRKKPARHPPQDSTNGPFKSDEPWNPESSEIDLPVWRSSDRLVLVEFLIGTLVCTVFGLFS